MPSIEVKAELSDAYLDMINAVRGGVSLDEYLRLALTLGLGHLQEEVIHQQRQKIYERLVIVSEGYHDALNVQRLEPAPPPGTKGPRPQPDAA